MSLVGNDVFGYRTKFKETHIVIICKDCQANLIYKYPDQPIMLVLQILAEPDLIISHKTSLKEYGITPEELEKIVDKLVAKCRISPHEFVSYFLTRKFSHFVKGAFVRDIYGTTFWTNNKFVTSTEGAYKLINIGILNLILAHTEPPKTQKYK